MLKLVLEGCNGDVVGAIEQCLSVDEARKTSRRSLSSSESGSSGATQTALQSIQTPQINTPTSPAEFFRNLTTTAQATTGRSPLLPTFPHYMVRVNIIYNCRTYVFNTSILIKPPPSLFLPCLYPGLAGLGATQLNSLQEAKWKSPP